MRSVTENLRFSSGRITAAIVSVAAFLLSNGVVLAQNAAPQPAVQSTSPAWQGYFFMFVLVVIAVFISLMPSKRGHQD